MFDYSSFTVKWYYIEIAFGLLQEVGNKLFT